MKWRIENKKVSELIEYEDNPRAITEKGMSDLKKSISKLIRNQNLVFIF